MSLPNNDDVISIGIQLKELQSKFDRAMREGEDFTAVKKIHMQIKELECHLHAMEWDSRERGIPANMRAGHDEHPFPGASVRDYAGRWA